MGGGDSWKEWKARSGAEQLSPELLIIGSGCFYEAVVLHDILRYIVPTCLQICYDALCEGNMF